MTMMKRMKAFGVVAVAVAVASTLAAPSLTMAASGGKWRIRTSPSNAGVKRGYDALMNAVLHPGRAYDHMGGDDGRMVAENHWTGAKFVLKGGNIYLNRVDPMAAQNGVVSWELGKNPIAPKADDKVLDPQAALAYRTLLENARSGGFDVLPLTRAFHVGQMTRFALPDTVLVGQGPYGTNVVLKNELFIDFKKNVAYGRTETPGHSMSYSRLGKLLTFAEE
jgi:hypothetical protein